MDSYTGCAVNVVDKTNGFYTPGGVTWIRTLTDAVSIKTVKFLYAWWRDVDSYCLYLGEERSERSCFYTPGGVTWIRTLVDIGWHTFILYSFYTPGGVTWIRTFALEGATGSSRAFLYAWWRDVDSYPTPQTGPLTRADGRGLHTGVLGGVAAGARKGLRRMFWLVRGGAHPMRFPDDRQPRPDS